VISALAHDRAVLVPAMHARYNFFKIEELRAMCIAAGLVGGEACLRRKLPSALEGLRAVCAKCGAMCAARAFAPYLGCRAKYPKVQSLIGAEYGRPESA
jgi:hypothetical protein